MSDEPVKEAAFFTTIRSWGITRGDQRVFGGVLSGVGARMGMAAAPTRIIFVILAIVTTGISLLAYAAAWALLPDSKGAIIIQDFGRGRPNVGALVAIGIVTLFGIGFFGNSGWTWWWNPAGWDLQFGDYNGIGWAVPFFVALVPLVLLGGLAAVIVWAVRSSRSANPPTSGFARLPDGTLPQGTAPTTDAADATATKAATPGAGSRTKAKTAAAAAPASALAVADAQAEPTAAPDHTAADHAAPAYIPPAYTPPVYTPPVYTAPPKPRVPGPGKLGYLLALAWIPLTIAITIYLSADDQLAVFPVIAAGVIYVAGLGLILVITALRGRKLGFLGFLSVVALIPVGVAIGAADEIREHYADGTWNYWDDPDFVYVEEPIYTPPPAFNAAAQFADYGTVAINGACYNVDGVEAPDVTGTVRLSTITDGQTITVTSSDTLLSIPTGTNLSIVNSGGTDGYAYANVTWLDRDVSCELTVVDTPSVQLSNPDAPTLTVYMDDTMTDGYQALWIEEN